MKYLVVSDNHSDREILVDLKMNSKIKSICSFTVGIQNFLKRILYGKHSKSFVAIAITVVVFRMNVSLKRHWIPSI